MALDVIPYVKRKGIKGNAIYTKKVTDTERKLYFHIISVCMLQAANEMGIKLSWGGNWHSFEDMPHYQLPRENS